MKTKTFISILVIFVFAIQGTTVISAYDNLATPVGITGQGTIPLTPGSLLDDFSLGGAINAWGDVTGAFSSDDPPTSTARCDVSYEDDANLAYGGAGSSLKLDYNVSKTGSYAGYFTKLGGMDLNAYKYLSFWVKGSAGGELLKIELKNNNNTWYWDPVKAHYYRNQASVYVNDFLDGGMTTSWQKVNIPLVNFANLSDLNSMKELVFVFENSQSMANGSPVSGSVYIDNISFGKTPVGAVRLDHFGDKLGICSLGGIIGSMPNPAVASHSFPSSGSHDHPRHLESSYDLTTAAWGGHFFIFGGGNDYNETVEIPDNMGSISVPVNLLDYFYFTFNVKARSETENPMVMKLELVDSTGRKYSPVHILNPITTSWKRYVFTLSHFAPGGVQKSTIKQLNIIYERSKIISAGGDLVGTLDFDEIQFEKFGYAPDTTPPIKPAITGMFGTDELTLIAGCASGSADASMENVRFEYNDGAWKVIGYDYDTTDSSYSVTWDVQYLAPGDYQVRAIAMDAAGNETISDERTYVRPNYVPVNGEVIPENDTFTAGDKVTYTTTAIDANGWQDFAWSLVGLESTTDNSRKFYCIYRPDRGNKLYASNGGPYIGGYVPGPGSPDIDGGDDFPAILHCSETTVKSQGDTLTINWVVTLKTGAASLGGHTCDVRIRCRDNEPSGPASEVKGTRTINSP